MQKSKIIKKMIGNLVAWIISAILLIPLLLVLFNSLKTKQASVGMPFSFPEFPLQFENYLVVIEKGKLLNAFLHSMIYSLGSVLICTILASMAAYVLSRNRTRLNNVLYFFIALGIVMPVNFVTLMKTLQLANLYNTRMGIVLTYAAIQLPFTFFLIYSFVGKIPRDIDEAGVIDGCSPLKLFFLVIWPLMKPVTITVMVLSFLNTWNEFTLPLYFVSNSSKWPMTLAVYNFVGMYSREWNLICADIVLTSLPVILVYLFSQKYIVSGMTAGAVKG